MIFEPSLHLCLVSPSAVMIRKELFDRKGLFRPDFPVCEDYEFWLRVSVDTQIHLIDEALTVKFGILQITTVSGMFHQMTARKPYLFPASFYQRLYQTPSGTSGTRPHTPDGPGSGPG
jgi:hypothetical protein